MHLSWSPSSLIGCLGMIWCPLIPSASLVAPRTVCICRVMRTMKAKLPYMTARHAFCQSQTGGFTDNCCGMTELLRLRAQDSDGIRPWCLLQSIDFLNRGNGLQEWQSHGKISYSCITDVWLGMMDGKASIGMPRVSFLADLIAMIASHLLSAPESKAGIPSAYSLACQMVILG